MPPGSVASAGDEVAILGKTWDDTSPESVRDLTQVDASGINVLDPDVPTNTTNRIRGTIFAKSRVANRFARAKTGVA